MNAWKSIMTSSYYTTTNLIWCRRHLKLCCEVNRAVCSGMDCYLDTFHNAPRTGVPDFNEWVQEPLTIELRTRGVKL